MDPVAAVIMTTTNSEQEANSLAFSLIKKKLAACVQIIPKIRSIYAWKGKIHDDQEYLLLVKAPTNQAEAIKKFIKKNHSYEIPELLVLPVSDGLEKHLGWMEKVTK